MENDKVYKILIIDDDKFLLDMYAIKFKEKGFEVHSAFGSINALDSLRDGSHFDVILTDIVMPAMDGFEFLEKIKKENLVNETKIIVLSNLGQPSDIEKGKTLGADGYIVKAATTPSEIVSRVIEIINKN